MLRNIKNKCFRWFNRKPPYDSVEVPIPPLKKDEDHNMTVLPYLVDHYYETHSDEDIQYFTERQLNGKIGKLTKIYRLQFFYFRRKTANRDRK